jgi:glyoxylase-like metal-dependent hydrolase (beta-lactamase superfamily II)
MLFPGRPRSLPGRHGPSIGRLRRAGALGCAIAFAHAASPRLALLAQPAVPSDSAAVALLRSALAALGGEAALRRAGGIEITGRGTVDLGVRLQGRRADATEPVPLEERLAIAIGNDGVARAAFESRTRVNPDAEEWIRTVYDSLHRTLLIDRLARRAFWLGGGRDSSAWRRVGRVVPHVLLAEAIDPDARLRLGEVRMLDGESVRAVAWDVDSAATLTLLVDRRSALLRGFEYDLTMPVRGAVIVRWTYDAYRNVDGVGPFPGGHTVSIDGLPLRRVAYTEVRGGADTSVLFEPIVGIEVPPPPEPRPPQPPDSAPQASRAPPDVRTLAPGVFLAPNVRGGFHHLFVEFADHVLVVDATAPWLELHEIPTGSRTSPDALGERLLTAVRSAVPDKPVRYLALTHHHGDHAGGAKPIVDAGATILTAPPTAGIARRVAPRARIELVHGARTIADSTMEVRLIDVGANPHVDGMLVVWLPRQRILYTSDLWEPTSPRFFPSVARTPVMRWFVEWLDRSGLDPAEIFAIHGSARVTTEQLETIRSQRSAPPS